LGEETGQHVHTDSDWAWVVDPLDGTNSYSQGLPVFCVSIGVTYKNDCVVGVVYAPYLNELYTAIKGEGAWLEKEPLHVSQKTSLKECVVASGFPYDKATNPINNIREVSIIVPQVRGFRRMGSAAYDLCCTAMGTIDAYWEYNLNPWDVCAGQLIVREAGGIVIPLCDNRKISIIAGPEALVKELERVINN
jgi:myo-inositol-1(or 4)-monophosphatase